MASASSDVSSTRRSVGGASPLQIQQICRRKFPANAIEETLVEMTGPPLSHAQQREQQTDVQREVMTSRFYDFFDDMYIKKAVSEGNYELHITLEDLSKAVTKWLYHAHYLPAGPEGHCLEWCMYPHPANGFSELQCRFLELLRKNGFTVGLETGGRPRVFDHMLHVAWASTPPYEFDFVFDTYSSKCCLFSYWVGIFVRKF